MVKKLLTPYGESMRIFLLSAALLALPSIAVRYGMRQETHFKGILQDLCIAATFALLLACRLTYVVCILNLLIGMDAFLHHRFGFRLEWSFFSFVKQYREFTDSAKEAKLFHWLPLFAAFFAFPLFLPKPPLLFSTAGVTIILWIFSLALLKTHTPSTCHFYFYSLRKMRFQKSTSFSFSDLCQMFSLQNEVCHVPDPNYPLYRETKGFKGKKRFNIHLQKGERPHIVMLMLESFRSKDLGSEVTPHFHHLAKEGIFFSNFYAQSPLTTRAMIPSLFGVPHTLEKDDYLDADLPLRGIPHILKEHGYQTHAFSGCSHLFRGEEAFYASNSFDDQLDCRTLRKKHPEAEGSHWGTKDEYLVEAFIDHLEKHQNSPQFYTLSTITNHHPWILPPSFSAPSLPKTGNLLYDRFLKTMHYTDNCLGLLVKRLREKQLASNTLLFILGDHGISFTDQSKNPLKIVSASQDLLHVPLLIHYEGHIEKPEQIKTPSCQYDLLPTILDLLELQTAHHAIGQSLLRQQPKRNLYFFYPFLDTSIGIFNGQKKGSYIPETETFYTYDWNSDPDEKMPLADPWPEGKEMAEKYPQLFNHLYKEKRFIPARSKETTLAQHIQLIPSSSREGLFQLFDGSRTIESLDLSQHREIDDDMLRHIGKQHPEIENIYLDHCLKITDVGMESFLKNSKGLQEIRLSNCMLLTSKTFDNLAKYTPSLINLCLSNTDLLMDLKNLPPLTALRGLILESLPQEQKDDFHFKRVFPNLFNLQISYLHSGVKRLKKLLEPLILYRLGLTDCETLKDEDLNTLFSHPPSWLCLTVLHLHHCHQITDRVIESLCHLPLETLSLLECPNITPDGIQILKKAIPNLKIVGSQQETTLPFLEPNSPTLMF